MGFEHTTYGTKIVCYDLNLMFGRQVEVLNLTLICIEKFTKFIMKKYSDTINHLNEFCHFKRLALTFSVMFLGGLS